ncbi:MAG TPA: SAM-dependent methyltransferase [Candidatus Limnocylindria bacterium]|nr:SAM-dependent methyltransferase [Candidatus Limnocylindria bacterium]
MSSRATPPPPGDDAGEPALIERLRAEIEAGGPITFARFMQRALYEPGLGYYATSRERTTRAGDFLTAPELHPIFAEAIAVQLAEMRERLGAAADFTVREYGAGRGTLAEPLPADWRHQPIEFNDRPDPTPIVGCVLANEFLDALPVHRVVQRPGGLRELYVGWRDGSFVEVEAELSDRALEAWFTDRAVELEDGQRAEVNLAILEWLASLPAQLERGYVLLIDYGAPAAELYGPHRRTGTLRAFRAHHVSSNVLGGVGRQDLTAHVDLDALERGAQTAGLTLVGRTTQTEFLVGCGLEELMAAWRARIGEDWQGQLALRSAALRLLDPRQMGGFAVVVLGREVNVEPPLRGLAYRVPRRAGR